MFKSVARGRLLQVAGPDGEPVDVRLYACQVIKPPYEAGGKTYAVLDASAAAGDLDRLRALNDFVRAQARPRFSPVRPDGALVVKLDRPKWETAAGTPGFAFPLDVGSLVDVVLRPGAFGGFGWCLLVHRLKPHALSNSAPLSSE